MFYSIIQHMVKKRNLPLMYFVGLLITNSIAALIVYLTVNNGYIKTLSLNSIGTIIGITLSLMPALNIYDSLIEAQEQSIKDFNTDALTGLTSRKPLLDEIQANLVKWNHEYPVGLMLIDLDHFKNINDTYGHQAGDSIMAEVGAILKDLIHKNVLVGRFGGEEFIIALFNQREKELISFAESIRQILDRSSIIDGQTINFTASVGCIISYEDRHLVDLIQIADEQMYKAKDSGRNQACYTVISKEASI